MDITISAIALIVLLPILILISVAIFLHDGGFPIYSQKRVGKNRKEFTFYKFRSMVKNADEILFSSKKLYDEIRRGNNKISDDPRITKVGKFLRKSSLDEVPQFINVLKGDMSFVGPRALRPDELAKFESDNPQYKEATNKILSVNPGITGFWQVSGRSKIDFKRRIEMEAEYASKKSVLFDILIIIKTPFAVLRAEGAQ